MTTIQKIITSAIIAGAIIILLVTFGGAKSKLGDVTNYNPLPYGTNVTDTGVLCTNSSGLLLATSTLSRSLVYLSNESTTTPIFLGMGNTAALHKGLMIPANTTLTLNQNTIYLGAIYCIASTNSTTTISAVN